jgi:hypothetical protein
MRSSFTRARAIAIAASTSLGCAADGAPGVVAPASVSTQGDGVDHGAATDPGNSLGATRGLRACVSASDCEGAPCLLTSVPDVASGTSTAMLACLAICALESSQVDNAPPFVVETCAPWQTCVVQSGIGLCATPCTSAADCATGFFCTPASDLSGTGPRACQPKQQSVGTPSSG